MSAPDPPAGYVSAAEACAHLNISDRTLRRRVAAGSIDGEYLPRPQGSVLYVRLPDDHTAEDAAPPSAPPAVPESEDAAITRLLDRVDDYIIQERALHTRIAALERENGRLESEATHAANAARIERERREKAEATLAERLADERERRLAAEQERDRLRAWRWWKPSTW